MIVTVSRDSTVDLGLDLAGVGTGVLTTVCSLLNGAAFVRVVMVGDVDLDLLAVLDLVEVDLDLFLVSLTAC